MRTITLFRATAWLGVAVVFWSLNVRWGTDTGVGGGPPTALWERLVVAAGLLAVVSAFFLSVSGRKENPPSWLARGIALVSVALVAVIVLYIRSKAAGPLESAIEGRGWAWLAAGGGLVAGAVLGSMGLRPPVKRQAKRRKRRR